MKTDHNGKTEKLLSVIIPVYMVEKYLDYCIQSVVNQSYKHLEIILVDDGSVDQCPIKCDYWAKKDSRIKVIHQKNGGGGKARNSGLDCCDGEYIAFVDSDDYIHPRMYEEMIDCFDEDTDIVECSYMKVFDDDENFNNDIRTKKVISYTSKDVMLQNICGDKFQQIIWNKVYRRELIGNIRFPEDKVIDDEFWTYQVLGKVNKAKTVDMVFYAYRQQRMSVMHLINIEKRFQIIEALIEKNSYLENRWPDLVSENIDCLWFACIYQGQVIVNNLKGVKKKLFINRMKEVLKDYPYSKLLKRKVTHKVWLVLAKNFFVITCYIRNLLHIGI